MHLLVDVLSKVDTDKGIGANPTSAVTLTSSGFNPVSTEYAVKKTIDLKYIKKIIRR